MDDTPEQEIPQEGPEDVSPSFKVGGKSKSKKSGAEKDSANQPMPISKMGGIPTPFNRGDAKEQFKERAREQAKNQVKKAATDVAKKIAKQIAQRVAQAVMSAISAAAAAVGWPVLVGCLVIFLIVAIIFGGLMALSISGHFGSTLPKAAGPNNADVKALVAAQKQPSNTGSVTGILGGGKTYYKFELPSKRDQEYLASGQIDERLAAALNYLVQKHQHIRVSHIVSGYEDMQIDPESGAFHDAQITKNISAHKRGEAADIDAIDFVKEKCDCGTRIPTQVGWQTIGENPFGETPDALNNVKSASDLADEKVKEALTKFGVQGLDQKDIEEKLKTISGIESPFDLTKPEVIAALNAIGVTGIDNPELQKGLKRLDALKQLYELNPQDLDALTSGAGADLLGQIGIQITPETKNSIISYQRALVLSTITGPDDLDRQDVRDALTSFGIDPADPKLKSSLEVVFAAKTLADWQGNPDDPKFQAAVKTLNLNDDPGLRDAIALYTAYKTGTNTPPGYVINDIGALQAFDQSGVQYDSPESQNTLSTMRAWSQILNPTDSSIDAAKSAAMIYVQINLSPANRELFEKYQAGYYIYHFHGSTDDPELKADLAKLNIPQSALEDFQTAADTIASLKKHTNLKELFPDDFQKLEDGQAILSIRKPGDLEKPEVRNALANYNINLDQADTVVQYANVIEVVKSITLNDIAKAVKEGVVANLNLTPSQEKYLGYYGDIQAIANIHSAWDLARPEVQKALTDAGVNTGELGTYLGYAGDINAIASIRSPEDFFKPEVIKAAVDFGWLDSSQATEMIGEIGAFQTILQARSIEDLLSPSGLLAMNTLNWIALPPQVVAFFMVASMIDGFFGTNIMGFFGQCKANTDCYKPAAQGNVHKAISELLQMPYDLNNPSYYRATQLITYSAERDVLPFSEQLDKLYGAGRPNNYGLFAMPEAHANLHIGY